MFLVNWANVAVAAQRNNSFATQKGKDLTLIQNYRPITLLPVDYKIFSKVLNHHIKNVLPFIIAEDQNGFINKRRISDNLRLLFDVIDFCDHYKVPATVVSLDIQKAFDLVSFKFLEKALEANGISDIFISYIKTLYCESNGSILNFGQISRRFSVNRGLRQGDPLSRRYL